MDTLQRLDVELARLGAVLGVNKDPATQPTEFCYQARAVFAQKYAEQGRQKPRDAYVDSDNTHIPVDVAEGVTHILKPDEQVGKLLGLTGQDNHHHNNNNKKKDNVLEDHILAVEMAFLDVEDADACRRRTKAQADAYLEKASVVRIPQQQTKFVQTAHLAMNSNRFNLFFNKHPPPPPPPSAQPPTKADTRSDDSEDESATESSAESVRAMKLETLFLLRDARARVVRAIDAGVELRLRVSKEEVDAGRCEVDETTGATRVRNRDGVCTVRSESLTLLARTESALLHRLSHILAHTNNPHPNPNTHTHTTPPPDRQALLESFYKLEATRLEARWALAKGYANVGDDEEVVKEVERVLEGEEKEEVVEDVNVLRQEYEMDIRAVRAETNLVESLLTHLKQTETLHRHHFHNNNNNSSSNNNIFTPGLLLPLMTVGVHDTSITNSAYECVEHYTTLGTVLRVPAALRAATTAAAVTGTRNAGRVRAAVREMAREEWERMRKGMTKPHQVVPGEFAEGLRGSGAPVGDNERALDLMLDKMKRNTPNNNSQNSSNASARARMLLHVARLRGRLLLALDETTAAHAVYKAQAQALGWRVAAYDPSQPLTHNFPPPSTTTSSSSSSSSCMVLPDRETFGPAEDVDPDDTIANNPTPQPAISAFPGEARKQHD
eukprot:jgi/Chlat1/4852/Chrsp31S04877